jgi:hypothetical protein
MRTTVATTIAATAFLSALTFGIHPAVAISRVSSTSHTCSELRGIVARQGQVIFTHPGSRGSGTLYDKYVADSGYCDASDVATEDYVPAKGGSCRLYNCRTYEPPFDNW